MVQYAQHHIYYFKCAIQQHYAHSPCCTTITTTHSQTFCVIPNSISGPAKHDIPLSLPPASGNHYSLSLWTSLRSRPQRGVVFFCLAYFTQHKVPEAHPGRNVSGFSYFLRQNSSPLCGRTAILQIFVSSLVGIHFSGLGVKGPCRSRTPPWA